jgi:transglutaminase-like putative cysteine protease
MRREFHVVAVLFLMLSAHIPHARAFDWADVTEADKNMKSNPLDPGAGAVVLFKRGQIQVLEKQSLFWTTRIQTYTRIKIFNEAGREYANVSVDAPKYMRLSKIEGRTILPSGQIIPLDSSQVFRGRAFEAGRNYAIIKTSFTFPSVEAGAIIEYQTEEYVDWFFPPPWIFDTNEVGTLDSSLRVLIGPRLGMAQFPLETTVNKLSLSKNETVQGTQFDFAVKNLHPIRREPYSVPFRDQATMVLFTPRELAFGGEVYPIITKWDDVATQMSRQFGDMEKSEKEAKNKAKELAGNLPDPRKKAEAIYKYLQQNITSSNLMEVYLGRTADELITSKRGDPDEINALFVIMLREVKVDADMVLVATQNVQTLVRGFPNVSQFSRIVTRVNLKDGVVFADPAEPAAPFGELPWFDRGVMGLAVKGSKVQEAAIPAGTPEDNLSVTKVSLQVGRDWKAEGDAEIDLKGIEAIDFRGDLLEESPEKVEQRLTDYFGYGHADSIVSNIAHPDIHDSSQQFVIKAHVLQKLSDESGVDELLLNPWLDDQYNSPFFKASERHSIVRFDGPEKRVSTSEWKLAPEIKIEQLPKEVKIDNDLGGFSHSCTQNGNTVTCTRAYYLKKTLLQTNVEYLSARKFFDEIAKNDQEVMVLRGK